MAGNAGQIVGYKLGAFFGSGILFWIYNIFNWNGLFATLTMIYSIVLFIFHKYSKNLSIIDNNNINQNDQLTTTTMNPAQETFSVRYTVKSSQIGRTKIQW